MEQGELMWLAGLMEGEGYFSLQKANTTEERWYARIGAAMTDRDVIERVASLLGVQAREEKPTSAYPGAKPLFRAVLCRSEEVKNLMKELYPHMGERRRARIDEILEIAWP